MVQPLGIVDHADERLFLSGLGEQAEYGQPDDEPVGGCLRAESERRLERITLWVGQSLPQIEHRRAQLMQAGVGELHLVLDASRLRHAAPGRTLHDVPQQCRLSDTWLAAHDQHFALTRPHALQQSIQSTALVVPTAQHVPRIFARHRPDATARPVGDQIVSGVLNVLIRSPMDAGG